MVGFKIDLQQINPKVCQETDDIYVLYIWVFPKIGVPQNGWFIMENPKTLLKWMIWGYPYFRKHPYILYIYIYYIYILYPSEN